MVETQVITLVYQRHGISLRTTLNCETGKRASSDSLSVLVRHEVFAKLHT